MESLALMVVALFLLIIVSAPMALVISWRAKRPRLQLLAACFGAPGALVGGQFLVHGSTLFSHLFGLFGLAGVVVPLVRWWRTRGLPPTSSTQPSGRAT